METKPSRALDRVVKLFQFWPSESAAYQAYLDNDEFFIRKRFGAEPFRKDFRD